MSIWNNKKQNQESNPYFNGSDLTITNYLTDGLLVFDKNNHLFLINPQGQNLLDVTKDESIGKSVLELTRYEKLEPLIDYLGAGLMECLKQEVKIGDSMIFEVTSVHMKVEQERVSTLVILHDITRERMSDTMKSEFVTLAAHQLRTPISGIKWSLQTLLDGDLGPLNEEQSKIVNEAFKTNNKVINLINDLLNVAEIEEGRYLSKVTLSDMREVLLEVINDYKLELEKKNISVDFLEPKDALPKVMLDTHKIKIAITNIFDNAVRYTPENGKITVSVIGYKEDMEVKIEDTGIGIPIIQQEKIFTKFFRSTNVRKIDTEGTGLGLYIAKNIIEAHDGKIWFESEQDKGTAVHFTIPIKKNYGQFLTSDFY
jgi:two-component system sensor histidine kinase VicK